MDALGVVLIENSMAANRSSQGNSHSCTSKPNISSFIFRRYGGQVGYLDSVSSCIMWSMFFSGVKLGVRLWAFHLWIRLMPCLLFLVSRGFSLTSLFLLLGWLWSFSNTRAGGDDWVNTFLLPACLIAFVWGLLPQFSEASPGSWQLLFVIFNFDFLFTRFPGCVRHVREASCHFINRQRNALLFCYLFKTRKLLYILFKS